VNVRLSRNFVFALAALSFGSGAAAASERIYACMHPDGSVALTTTNAGPQCNLVASSDTPESASLAPAAPAAPGVPVAQAAPLIAVASGAPKGSAKDKAVEDPRKLYRDAMIEAARRTDGDTSAPYNPALSRRYLRINRADYVNGMTSNAAR
jgi:hypothetical protein